MGEGCSKPAKKKHHHHHKKKGYHRVSRGEDDPEPKSNRKSGDVGEVERNSCEGLRHEGKSQPWIINEAMRCAYEVGIQRMAVLKEEEEAKTFVISQVGHDTITIYAPVLFQTVRNLVRLISGRKSSSWSQIYEGGRFEERVKVDTPPDQFFLGDMALRIIDEGELELIKRMLPDYIRHIQQPGMTSCLERWVGLFTVVTNKPGLSLSRTTHLLATYRRSLDQISTSFRIHPDTPIQGFTVLGKTEGYTSLNANLTDDLAFLKRFGLVGYVLELAKPNDITAEVSHELYFASDDYAQPRLCIYEEHIVTLRGITRTQSSWTKWKLQAQAATKRDPTAKEAAKGVSRNYDPEQYATSLLRAFEAELAKH